MQKKDYSISILKSIKILQQEFRKLVFQNSYLIEKISDDFILSLKYKKNDAFFFRVSSNPKLTPDFRSFFNFNYFPQDEHFIEKTNFNNEVIEIIRRFSIWIDLIKEYDEIDLDEEEVQTKFYEDEFYEDFEILDDDAYTVPFEHQRQIILYNFLTYIESELKKQPVIDSEIQSLITETEDFKNNIQNLSKNTAIRALSRLLAKIKKKGLSLIMEILNEAKKEMIKKALTGGFNELGNYIHHIF